MLITQRGELISQPSGCSASPYKEGSRAESKSRNWYAKVFMIRYLQRASSVFLGLVELFERFDPKRLIVLTIFNKRPENVCHLLQDLNQNKQTVICLRFNVGQLDSGLPWANGASQTSGPTSEQAAIYE